LIYNLKRNFLLLKIKIIYKIIKIENNKITIDLNNHLYYTNDILSHNTLFLTAIASKGIQAKKNVLYFSFEMPETQIRY